MASSENFELAARRNKVFCDTNGNTLSTCPPIMTLKLSQYAFLVSSILTADPAFIDSRNMNRLNNNYCIRSLFNNVVCNSESIELNDSLKMNFKGRGRRWSWHNLTYYLRTYLQILNFQVRHSRCVQ